MIGSIERNEPCYNDRMPFDLARIMRDIIFLDHVQPDRWAHTYELYGITADDVRAAVVAERQHRADVELLRKREEDHGE